MHEYTRTVVHGSYRDYRDCIWIVNGAPRTNIQKANLKMAMVGKGCKAIRNIAVRQP